MGQDGTPSDSHTVDVPMSRHIRYTHFQLDPSKNSIVAKNGATDDAHLA